MKSILVAIAVFALTACTTEESDDPTCVEACDWVTTCNDPAQTDFWVCDECDADILASTPLDSAKMAPVGCALADFNNCTAFLQCLTDSR